MNLENHRTIHTVVILLFYNLGLAFNVLSAAYLSSRSSLNSIGSIRAYFRNRWVPVGLRWFLCLCLFFVVWENNSILNLEKFMPNFAAHVGVAGLLGFASDQLWDKVLAIVFPGIQKELPPIPPPDVPPIQEHT